MAHKDNLTTLTIVLRIRYFDRTKKKGKKKTSKRNWISGTEDTHTEFWVDPPFCASIGHTHLHSASRCKVFKRIGDLHHSIDEHVPRNQFTHSNPSTNVKSFPACMWRAAFAIIWKCKEHQSDYAQKTFWYLSSSIDISDALLSLIKSINIMMQTVTWYQGQIMFAKHVF
jgi:hypothetical protein